MTSNIDQTTEHTRARKPRLLPGGREELFMPTWMKQGLAVPRKITRSQELSGDEQRRP